MRILQVRFKNLNSLYGEWQIDLTDPAFAADGIFAITGPTGAGKSTILDAVCLALYGCTPRLTRINQSSNEIMSRQTGDCFAEVTFESQTGRYRCHWSQHRSRRRPEGALQAPKREIADAASGQILGSNLQEVAGQIEAATGMDFDRFTRSMLLAQGGFAAFLQAAADERAPILEQITGTEIYSRISVRVHERRVTERRQLEVLLAESAGLQPLTEEEEGVLMAGLAEKTNSEAALRGRIDLTNQALAWLDGVAGLERELQQIASQKQEWQQRHQAFAVDRERLSLAIRALEPAGEYAGLLSIRRELAEDNRRLTESRSIQPTYQEAARLAEEAMGKAVVLLGGKKAEREAAVPVLQKVRELDLRLKEKIAPIKAAAEAVRTMDVSRTALCHKQEEDFSALAAGRKKLEELQRQVDASRNDAGLVEHLTGIHGRFAALQELLEQQGAKLEEIGKARSQLTETSRICQEQNDKLAALKQVLEEKQALFTAKEGERCTLLAGRELTDWRESLATLADRRALLARVAETTSSLAETRRNFADLGKRRDTLMVEQNELGGRLQSQSERRTVLERELGLLETQLSLVRHIQNLSEARSRLRDGEACPLCGALEHPFAAGNIPLPEATDLAVERTRSDLKAGTEGMTVLQVRLAEVNRDLEHVLGRLQECSTAISASENLLNMHWSELSIDLAGRSPDEVLPALHGENEERMQRASRIVQAVELLDKELAALRDLVDQTREAVVQAESAVQTAAHKKDSVGQLLDRLQREGENLADRGRLALAEVQRDLTPYGLADIVVGDLDRIRTDLTARRQLWLAREQEKVALVQQIAALEIRTGHQAEQLSQAEVELQERRKLLCALQDERDLLGSERRELFGEKIPDEEELRLVQAVGAAELGLDSARRHLEAANRDLGQLQGRIAELEKAIMDRSDQLCSAEEHFRIRLVGLGFADETVYLAAGLPEEERQDLQRRMQQLVEEQAGILAREGNISRRLEDERQKQLTDQGRDDLAQIQTGLIAAQVELQQEIGALRQRLHDNEELKQRLQERAGAIDRQRQECARWQVLHELIGSADGKKYRNFAQGITFQMMIGHANRQLRRMTDRYLLIRDEVQPLELNVIDSYQAGEIRSTKNLSGGESFIVSLSLALGLSQMASRNVRVDSLFLDEGFGTLDEEALDTALQTLAGLRQEGKLIGVISHVPALRERIGTRIRVRSGSGGRSRIEGPGCRKMEE